MPQQSVLKVARTPGGYCLRVEGRGTMRESQSAAQFVAGPLEREGATVVVDLSACDHLDSTFLGCLVEMQRKAGKSLPPRLVISARSSRFTSSAQSSSFFMLLPSYTLLLPLTMAAYALILRALVTLVMATRRAPAFPPFSSRAEPEPSSDRTAV